MPQNPSSPQAETSDPFTYLRVTDHQHVLRAMRNDSEFGRSVTLEIGQDMLEWVRQHVDGTQTGGLLALILLGMRTATHHSETIVADLADIVPGAKQAAEKQALREAKQAE